MKEFLYYASAAFVGVIGGQMVVSAARAAYNAATVKSVSK